ncbi:transcription-repair coupling factor [Novimethylophilus kurashikiensis]|uniref:Transcription-repair-coupling factor n=1 Tax=Novimethylophilus kurashikiensis TaxID=1825523 RepID=A0A2R5F0H8_9PROT|nr:transcription-repair coupling factor [Novimethylophilus kurashikiensis]GBG12476.1 transcription-repair coupling factor [Novimethylophilus kurashikiensis]
MSFRISLPKPGALLRQPRQYGSADSLYFAQLKAATPQSIVIVTETPADAQRLVEEIKYFAPQFSTHLLPDWETLPYDHFSPHPDLVSERLATLYQIGNNACDIAVLPISTALMRLPPQQYLAAHSFLLKKGEKLDLEALRAQCAKAGYQHVNQVVSPGEFSVRGGLVDLFPTGSALPYRIDLFDDEIETIRTFDVDNQRSLYPVSEIRLLPAREFPLDEAGINQFRQSFRETFEGDPSKSRIYKDVSNGLAPGGAEWYLPLFFESTATLFDYLSSDTLLCLHGDPNRAAEAFLAETRSRHRLLDYDRERPILPPDRLMMTSEDFFTHTHQFARISFGEGNGEALPIPDIGIDRRAEAPVARLKRFADNFSGRVLLAAESLGRRETLSHMLVEHGIKTQASSDWNEFVGGNGKFMLGVAPVHTGFISENLAIITEGELYPSQVRQERRREKEKTRNAEGMLKDLAELREHDPVVHEQHGVGRYRGLVNLDFGEGATEFLLLEYAGDDKLYVPVSQLFLISRYSGGPAESAPLHKLGSGQWDKAKKKALKQIRDTAAELLNLYAMRAARQGHAFKLSLQDYDAFADGFPFEETPDQEAAIEAVIRDMQSGKPMDRLVCGDVGFGKTEVALRAAFVAVMGGRQVAVLVPTTLLAEQHFNNFSDRFAEWPVKIAEISRFRTAKEQSAALEGLAKGEIDIIIGTHRLIQKDVKFKNLGLIIIDEEHRFGVRQKEQLKALRAEVDVLTLTATPIPRTLSMAMEGLREFSVIATPPQKRLSIKTFVSPWSEGIIREAVLRELKRGGQMYFLHNEVDTIYSMREKLEKMLPEARIGIAHGQLRERELEHVMRDFYQQRFNMLLCTTIIETGIDIPSANTIIINRADNFGLAQLHQLRGRVGRSHHQAYAYLLTDPNIKLKAQAEKRLEAIQLLEDLGAGFHLAMHDLEIRGAGELLGDNQSGEMQEIGFTLYADMLNHAVKQLKAGKEPDLSAPLGVTTEINLHTPALLPDDYCGDVHERLVLYKRLASCTQLEELQDMKEELIDRFGLLPDQTQALMECHRLRILAKPLSIIKIDASSEAVQLHFAQDTTVDPLIILKLLQKSPAYRMNGPDKLRIAVKQEDVRRRADFVEGVLKSLQGA